MTKTNKKLFFLIFSSLLLLSVISVCSSSVKADIIHNPTITANHLEVSAGAFNGPNTWGSSQQIHCYTGGEDLLLFENLGQVAYDSENNQLLYEARAIFGFEGVIYSTVSPSDIDPGFTVNMEKSVDFLGVHKYAWIGDPYQSYTVYKIDYKEVDFEIVNTHKYTGYFPIEIGIKNTIGFGGELQVGEYTFQMPALVYDIMDLDAKDYHHSAVGVWDNEFINYNQYEEGRLTIEDATEHTANSDVMDWINNRANIGWKVGPIGSPITLQNYMVFGDSGYHVDNGVFNLNFGLQPKITETMQYNEYTWASIWWDTHDFPFSPAGMGFTSGPSTSQLQRRIAANVENRMQYWNFETEIRLFMTVQPDHVLSEDELREPFFEQGDWVWDTTFQGDIPTLPEDTISGSDMVAMIVGIIIFALVIVAIGVAIYVYIQKNAISSAVPSKITIKS
jgi:hypothetical protein